MTLLEWLSLAALCLTGAASPGPSLAVVVSACATGGRPGGLASAWSHAVGVGLYAALTVFGLSVIIAAQPGLFLALQILGALYLLWLAWGLWRAAGDTGADDGDDPVAIQRAARDGFAVAFLNPKLAVFMLALFSQFVRPDAGVLANATLIATATLIDGLWYSLVTVMITRSGWLARLRARGGIINRLFAGLLAALAFTILARALL